MTRRKSTTGNDMNDDSGTAGTGAKVAAEGVGGVAGAAGGAALGSIVGPVGTLVGALAGAVGGWWAGKNVAENAGDFDSNEDHYRSHFESNAAGHGDLTYDRARPVYQLGHIASQNPDYVGRSFDDVEPDIKRGWNDDLRSQYGEWDNMRPYAAEAFNRGGQRTGMGSEDGFASSERDASIPISRESESMNERSTGTSGGANSFDQDEGRRRI